MEKISVFKDHIVIIRKKLAILFVIIFQLLITPLFVSLFILMFLIRQLVLNLSKIIRPDLDTILTPSNTCLAIDEVTTNPKFSIVVRAVVKGNVDIDKFKLKLVKSAIGVRNVGGELKNIEMKQYPFKWMGFIFWKWDENFDISNHVKYFKDEDLNPNTSISMERVRELEQELTFKPFPERRSPWEFIICPKVESESEDEETVTVIFMHVHHLMGDGYAYVNFLKVEIFNEEIVQWIPLKNSPKKNVLQQLLFATKVILKTPYETANLLVESRYRNDWKISKAKFSNKWILSESDKISMDVIKEVKHELKSSVSAIIFAGFTAAVRKSMLKKNGRTPKNIHIAIGFPLPNHPGKLGNYSSVVVLKLPVGEPSSVERLKRIDQSLREAKNSALILMHPMFTYMGGNFFYWMLQPMTKFSSSITAGGSSLPGPKVPIHFLGQEILDWIFRLGPLIGNVGLNFQTSTYNGYFKVALMVNESILSEKSDVDEIAHDFLQEFENLRRGVISNGLK